MYQLCYTSRFKKDLRLCQKRGLDMSLIRIAIEMLERTGALPQRYLPHRLKGNRKRQWECHILPYWLMIWEQNDKELTLLFLESGTHSDLYGK